MTFNFQKKQKISTLRLREKPVLETTALNTLKTTLGQGQSRDIVERAACEVSDRLSRLDSALSNGDLARAAKIAGGLIGISEQIGLRSFAVVARDLVGAIHANDYVAIAAISRRLIRQGDANLFHAIDYVSNQS